MKGLDTTLVNSLPQINFKLFLKKEPADNRFCDFIQLKSFFFFLECTPQFLCLDKFRDHSDQDHEF